MSTRRYVVEIIETVRREVYVEAPDGAAAKRMVEERAIWPSGIVRRTVKRGRVER